MTDIAEQQVGTSTDDALNEGATYPGDGNFLAAETRLWLGFYEDIPLEYDIAGLRFTLPVPKRATINSASISVCSNLNAQSHALRVYIGAEDVDDAATFAADTHEPYDAWIARTTAVYDWNVGVTVWTAGVWYGGTAQTNPNDVSAIVQEIVNRDGWVSGQHIVFVIWDYGHEEGSHDRDIRTWDYAGNARGARLNCNYTAAVVPGQTAMRIRRAHGSRLI